jgi:hypothetical protein
MKYLLYGHRPAGPTAAAAVTRDADIPLHTLTTHEEDRLSMTLDSQPNCRKCRFYYITWEPQHPHGCRAMGFKAKELPSVIVLKNSGKPCLLFQKKGTSANG